MWARYTFRRYSDHQEHFPGTGGELARHLIKRFGLEEVTAETTPVGDHYDPLSKTVRLTEGNYNGKSLTAIAVAAHEVGHAIQHHRGSPLLNTRTRLVQFAQIAEKAGSVAMLAIPVVAGVTGAPSMGLFMFAIGIGSLLVSTLVHLVTLPVEWDASFGKALPILREGDYIQRHEQRAVEKILRAAALTYVAASLASLLNLARWIAILRR